MTKEYYFFKNDSYLLNLTCHQEKAKRGTHTLSRLHCVHFTAL